MHVFARISSSMLSSSTCLLTEKKLLSDCFLTPLLVVCVVDSYDIVYQLSYSLARSSNGVHRRIITMNVSTVNRKQIEYVRKRIHEHSAEIS